MIAEVTTGDHSKRTDSRERSRFRSTQSVFAIAVADNAPFGSAGQTQVPREDVPEMAAAFARWFANSTTEIPIVARVVAGIVIARVKHDTLRVTIAQGQNGDNRRRFGVGGGCPPPLNSPIKPDLFVSSGPGQTDARRLLTGGLLVRVQPEEPIKSTT